MFAHGAVKLCAHSSKFVGLGGAPFARLTRCVAPARAAA
jgi:hypothetical protein